MIIFTRKQILDINIIAGASAVLIEEALCDGQQSIDLTEFTQLMSDLRKIALATGRNIS